MACMSPSTRVQLVMATTGISVTLLGILYGTPWVRGRLKKRRDEPILNKLPRDLETWRAPGDRTADFERVWVDADEILQDVGLRQWPYTGDMVGLLQSSPQDTCPVQNGYSHVAPTRGISATGPGTMRGLARFMYLNPLNRAARTAEGNDVIVRVLAIKNHGLPQLAILRKLATGPQALLTVNHTLPMLREIHFENIVFGIFPKVGGSMKRIFGSTWPRNSVGDALNMLMQALEGLAYIHSLNIAHRDAFTDNFLVQWQPESLRTMEVSVSVPRVYLIDFEVATSFEADCPKENCVCTGYPTGSSISRSDNYSRCQIPEFHLNEPYNPFKLDVWQLGVGFDNYKSAIEPIDDALRAMTAMDPAARLDANEALTRFRVITQSMSPQSLLIPFEMFKDPRASAIPSALGAD